MNQTASPYLAPSVVIGLGEWGCRVAGAAGAALRDRSPALARACPVLEAGAPAPEDPTLPGQIRAALKASRMAEVIRALEQEGLMQLDPEVAPATHVYLVASLADDPGLALVRRAATAATDAGRELRASVLVSALLDLGEEAELPEPLPGVALYVTEPVTARGLVLDPAEYRAAVAEVLVAAAQPGGSALLGDAPRRTGARGSVGTVGIAWLAWSPAALQAGLARRLSREALERCVLAADPPAGVRPSSAGKVSEQRTAGLLEGLPFRASHSGDLVLTQGGAVPNPTRLRREAAVLGRRLERWCERLEQNRQRREAAEEEALARGVEAELAAGPDGAARARALLAEVARAPGAGRPQAPAPAEVVRLAPALKRLAEAEAMPDRATTIMSLAGGLLLFTLLWWLLRAPWSLWITVVPLMGLGVTAYLQVWRPWRIRTEAEGLQSAMVARAEALMQNAFAQAFEALDRKLEARCRALGADLDAAVAGLRSALGSEAAAGRGGALCFPLAGDGAEEHLMDEVRHLAPDVAAYLGAAGCFAQWREPGALAAEAERLTAEFLARRVALDPAALAARAYGDRLAQRLDEAVRGLLGWSQPLLARHAALPEARRWLLWPEGLPCPPLPAEVQVLPFARGSAAVVTVISGIAAGIRQHGGRKKEGTTA